MNTVESKRVIGMTIKEFFALCSFLLTLGGAIGGYLYTINELKDNSKKLEEVKTEIKNIEIQNAKIQTTLDIKCK